MIAKLKDVCYLIIFQCTVSICHPVKRLGLMNVLEKVKGIIDPKHLMLVFLTPPKTFAIFSKPQSIMTVDKKVAAKQDICLQSVWCLNRRDDIELWL